MRIGRALFIGLMFLAGASASAATLPWTFKTAHFLTVEGDLLGITEAGITVRMPDGGERALAWDEFLAADRNAVAPTAAKGFALVLTNGDRMWGEPGGVVGEKLKWRGAMLDEIEIPLTRVAAMVKADHPTRGGDEKRTEDSVSLANGDAVRGIISEVSDKAIVIQSNGQPVTVPLDSVLNAHFASAGGAVAGAERGIRLNLVDDSSITANTIRLEGGKIALGLEGGVTRQVDLANVAGIEQINGPVSWLSSRPPIENVQTPYFEASFPARMNQSVTGKPIRAGEKTFSRGIGVHSYSRMSWDLDGDYNGFRTQYAIDGDGPYANVTVRIKLDDRVVHEKTDVTAGQLAAVMAIPLEGAKRLTLEVDYGKTYDTQDRFNWVEPALLKVAGATTTP
jgi:hypothetical protein